MIPVMLVIHIKYIAIGRFSKVLCLPVVEYTRFAKVELFIIELTIHANICTCRCSIKYLRSTITSIFIPIIIRVVTVDIYRSWVYDNRCLITLQAAQYIRSS